MLRIASTNTFIFTICLLLCAKESDSVKFFFLFSLAKVHLILVILCVNVFVLPMDSHKNTKSPVHVTTKRRSWRTRKSRKSNDEQQFLFVCFLVSFYKCNSHNTYTHSSSNNWTLHSIERFATCCALAWLWLFFLSKWIENLFSKITYAIRIALKGIAFFSNSIAIQSAYAINNANLHANKKE